MTTTTKPAFQIHYERIECDRCDGTGVHSYNRRTGTVCFKCNGRK